MAMTDSGKEASRSEGDQQGFRNRFFEFHPIFSCLSRLDRIAKQFDPGNRPQYFPRYLFVA
jgi:hypothetical protein